MEIPVLRIFFIISANCSVSESVSPAHRLAFLDHTRLCPKDATVGDIGFFEGYACQGFLYLYGMEPPELTLSDHLLCACSKAREGYSIRMLAGSGDAIHRFARHVLSQCF